ncbi:SHOCT domain-containing protein [Epibacterium ulvae]|uniref:SHOCT domain-containing protein n=1 Tax=Epibacterium ulvae TaxID=1156985 RepID=UPI001BFC54DF|nr:SHOCT domain-containing protein [Epibacterium ulvae]MBT8155069.1 SHOCT domain-containing protein [Epibacterium ulvae]
MTAILEDLRRLDAARKRGDISHSVYEEAKGRLLGQVEDVQIVAEAPNTANRAHDRSEQDRPGQEANNQGLWSLLLVGLLGAGIMTFVLAQLIGDLTIAVTLVVTVFAAILVKAAKRLEH